MNDFQLVLIDLEQMLKILYKIYLLLSIAKCEGGGYL